MDLITLKAGFLPWQSGIFSLFIYSAMIAGLMIVLLVLARRLGRHHPDVEKLRPYESGIIPTGPARLHNPVPFFMVAIFFLLFDLEGVFIFTYAIAADGLGWAGFLQIGFFIAVLMAGLIYIWVKGGLRWGPNLGRK